MADAGAVRIQALLETPSSALAKALEKLQAGLGAAEGLEVDVPISTATAIERLRSIYAGMAQEIEGIDTRGAIKGEALAALAKMDIGLKSMLDGLSLGGEEEAVRAYSMAVRRLNSAGAGIDRAIAGVR
jgi:hypothetical protein